MEEPEDEGFDETLIPKPTDKGAAELFKNKNVQVAALAAVVIFGLLLFLMLNWLIGWLNGWRK